MDLAGPIGPCFIEGTAQGNSQGRCGPHTRQGDQSRSGTWRQGSNQEEDAEDQGGQAARDANDGSSFPSTEPEHKRKSNGNSNQAETGDKTPSGCLSQDGPPFECVRGTSCRMHGGHSSTLASTASQTSVGQAILLASMIPDHLEEAQ